jgi:hypothetical protein|nr:MAG TPA: hypothetical protein [Caudoviricetes sp.]
MSAAWDDIKSTLPPGLNGALASEGQENRITPVGFSGLDFEVVPEFDLIVEHESGEEREIGEDCTVGWIVDKVLRAWLENETGFYNHLVIDAGRVFWFNPNVNPEEATFLVDVWEEGCWRSVQTRLGSAVRLIAYEKARRWVSNVLNSWDPRSWRITITSTEKRDDSTEFRIWDRECYLPVKIVTVYAFGRVDVRPAPDGNPDAVEFCPGERPTGLSSESEDVIKALLNRVRESLEANNRSEK